MELYLFLRYLRQLIMIRNILDDVKVLRFLKVFRFFQFYTIFQRILVRIQSKWLLQHVRLVLHLIYSIVTINKCYINFCYSKFYRILCTPRFFDILTKNFHLCIISLQHGSNTLAAKRFAISRFSLIIIILDFY